ncbi:SDR family NAD(P)-dependent oxidoreductase [Roseovarius nitratireducens]|uniref:SDR family NAD(P)-dependent oxidoreductase n=1 Tax=Roseovarius nitratireducens TaxID=2044597 RepID=UPI000CE2880B|nr:SDR family NAD(P)-dependent oxidoreductase [Roseovarius nitratireducens]
MTHTMTALITGAGSGIGRALAIEAARRGYTPILVGRTKSSLLETQALVPDVQARIVVADVTTAEGRHAIVEAAGHRLDVLINNAGTLSVGHLRDTDDAALEQMCATNLVAPMAVTRDLLPALRQAQGRVANIGSVFGDIAYPFFAAYSATKFGLRGFSDALRRELSGSGVGVTYIAPRATRTAAEAEFAALVEPLAMTLDSAEQVAAEAWAAIKAGRRESFPRGKERLFVKVQRLFPSLVDRSVGAQARDTRTLRALEPVSKA